VVQLEALEDRQLLSSLPVAAPTLARPDAATQARVSRAYGQIPLSFEANRGQADARIDYLARGSGYTLFLTPQEAVLSLQQPAATGTDRAPAGDVLRMRLVGSNPHAQVLGLDQQAGISNYLVGNDPGRWHTDIANFGKVEYRGVYRGIDVVYYGNQRQLEYDLVVNPGADPRPVKLAFGGARMELDARGDLVLHAAGGDVVEHAPVLYQEIDGVRHAVSGRYVLKGNGQVGFEVGAYDHTRPLVIDPVLAYSSYLGGNRDDKGYGIAVDGAGNAYLTGYTASTSFPTKSPLQPGNASPAGPPDAFVAKLNADGSALVYSTYLGGRGGEQGEGIAVDGLGNAYVTGYTQSSNFPTVNALQSAFGGGFSDAFVAKLNAAGNALLYSTYLGGSSEEDFTNNDGDIAVDGLGNAYVTGYTKSSNFPSKDAVQGNLDGTQNAFVTKLDTTRSGADSLAYSTYLRGTYFGYGIAVDAGGNAYVTGSAGTNLPTTPGAFQAQPPGGSGGAFVTKLKAAGPGLVYSTYLGGSGGGHRL
jgi:hypothetical protein